MSVPTALTPPKVARNRTVCAQATKRFNAADIPLAQRDLHGSRDWYASWNRRNRVEGFFGNIKDEARESIRRGIVRVRTKEKVGLVVGVRRRSSQRPPCRSVPATAHRRPTETQAGPAPQARPGRLPADRGSDPNGGSERPAATRRLTASLRQRSGDAGFPAPPP